MTLSEELQWRGFVNQTTYPDLKTLDKQPLHFYWGVDPSANSMTIGNLAAAMMVKCFIKHGHKAMLLVGGATGLIGDPDGKSEERELKSIEEIAANKTKITAQYRQIFGGEHFQLVDNYDWFKDMHYLDFLREVGKHIPLRQMLGRDFVQKRLGEQGSGISYAEFSYVLIQAYDFLHLYLNHKVTLQVCGADQWGNCIAGVDLIRRKTGGQAHVFSAPLIVNESTGQKFGKSEGGAVWLAPDKTSPFQFYQFWLNVDDNDVGSYLKIFTELDKEKIAHLMTDFETDRSSRLAQKTLAHEVTKLMHGQDEADKQVKIAEAIAQQNLIALEASEIHSLVKEIGHTQTPAHGSIVAALVGSSLATSNSDAQRLLSGNAISINGQKVDREKFEPSDFHDGYLLLRRGKAFKDSALVELKDA